MGTAELWRTHHSVQASWGPSPQVHFCLQLYFIFPVTLAPLPISQSQALLLPLSWNIYTTLEPFILHLVNLYYNFSFASRFLPLLAGMGLFCELPLPCLIMALHVSSLLCFEQLESRGSFIGIKCSYNEGKEEVQVVCGTTGCCWGPVTCVGPQEGSLLALPATGRVKLRGFFFS